MIDSTQSSGIELKTDGRTIEGSTFRVVQDMAMDIVGNVMSEVAGKERESAAQSIVGFVVRSQGSPRTICAAGWS